MNQVPWLTFPQSRWGAFVGENPNHHPQPNRDKRSQRAILLSPPTASLHFSWVSVVGAGPANRQRLWLIVSLAFSNGRNAPIL